MSPISVNIKLGFVWHSCSLYTIVLFKLKPVISIFNVYLIGFHVITCVKFANYIYIYKYIYTYLYKTVFKPCWWAGYLAEVTWNTKEATNLPCVNMASLLISAPMNQFFWVNIKLYKFLLRSMQYRIKIIYVTPNVL